MSGTVESKLSRKYLLNVARKFVSINHTGKWQIGIGLSLAGKNLHGCSYFFYCHCKNHGEHKCF